MLELLSGWYGKLLFITYLFNKNIDFILTEWFVVMYCYDRGVFNVWYRVIERESKGLGFNIDI